ncbi:MAG TPA: SigB/SigF/SigG family RNA polymerase sigma factor [Acidimicrobiales bacterium]|nr:SigB/SigF/SigG family RNA polymerase sigma factor [Acidimicrobiales bacterium]
MLDATESPHTPHELWVEFAATRDSSLRDRLITENLGLARRLAHRFAHRGQSYDDLAQVASIALIKAVDRYDPERNVKFSTFATGTIIGELKRHFRDRGWAVRAPRRIQELYLELGATIESLGHELGRSPTVSELARATAASEESIVEAIEAGQGYRSASLDAPAVGGATLGDILATEDSAVALVEERSVIEPALALLPPRNREIVKLRFIDGLTQSEIASRIGISQMHVSRLLATSLAQLREAFAAEP